jgi:hypothetical protein
MIYKMAQNLEAKLRARRFPIEVVYGKDRLSFVDFTSNLIRVERDPEQSDSFSPPKAAQGGSSNQPMRATRGVATRVTIYGQSPLSGAMPSDHDHETDQLVDAFIVALAEWVVEAKASIDPLAITEARFVTDKGEREALHADQWPGAVYLLRFRVPRGVRALNYVSGAAPGTPREQGTVTAVENEIRILVPGGSPEIV